MSYIEPGQTIVVTPNKRLASNLRNQFDIVQKNAGKSVWQSYKILPLKSWLENCWQNCNPSQILLNNHQAHFLWQKIINNSLLNTKRTIDQVQQAYKLLHEWSVSIDNPLFNISEDTLVFKNWVKKFDEQCKANNWIEAGNLPQELISKKFQLPENLILAGFDQLTPQINKLIKGCQVEHFDPNTKTSQQGLLSFPDQEQEIINMALWAKECLTKNPSVEIGCIVPNLTTIRAQIEYILTKITPQNFDISIGQNLYNFPLIHAALKILNSITAEARSPSDWVKYFIKELQTANWPYADNYPLIKKWQELLEQFTSLTLIAQQLSSTEALAQLKTIAEHTIYQPAQANAQIKILGTLEAAGLNFDHLWIMGMNDKNWPPPARPHPFIPIELQRQLHMPHSDAERELEFCRLLTERFSRSADNIIYSYATQHQDEQLTPSSLIKHGFTGRIHRFAPTASFLEPCVRRDVALSLETIIDDHAPPITKYEKIRGGSKIFKLQAACPFRAFAECRLGAKELETTQMGINAKERGLLVHELLEKIWHKISDHAQLCAYSKKELTSIIQKTVNERTNKYKPQFAKLESKRLEKLLLEWLTLEKIRMPFKVLVQEKRQIVNFGAYHEIPIRVDRIDQLEDGSLIILDYKTGKTSVSSWLDERPDEPQLPLYCITSPKPVDGIIFAQVKSGDLKFKGKTKVKDLLPNVKAEENWSGLIANWQLMLENLGKNFSQGNAKVDPKDDKTCNYCKLRSLCRVKNYAHSR
jgi:hypothetical protein